MLDRVAAAAADWRTVVPITIMTHRPKVVELMSCQSITIIVVVVVVDFVVGILRQPRNCHLGFGFNSSDHSRIAIDSS